MKILYGLMSGSVLQREDNNFCRVLFAAEVVGAPRSSLGMLTVLSDEGDHMLLSLSGIAAGGPYTLTLSDDADEITLTEIYVGDVWLLGGQSNMDGVAYIADSARLFTPKPYLRSFSLSETEWEPVTLDPHRNHLSPHPYMNAYVTPMKTLFRTRCVGPGCFFAEEMYRRSAVPQGVIPCALGGSSLAQWNPDAVLRGEENLYTIAVDRLRLCGGRIKGIFWYQGCAETGPDASAIFVDNMKRMVAAFRDAAENPALPFVQVQIYRYFCASPADDYNWSHLRELQRTLADHIPYLDTVHTSCYTMADGIHLDGKSQKKLAIQAAESMYHLCFDPLGHYSRPAPVLLSASHSPTACHDSNTLAVRFGNLHGTLRSEGAPIGFALSSRPDSIDLRHIFRIDLMEDTAYLRHEIPEAEIEDMYLSYLFGNGTCGNITDGEGRPIPAFGPIRVSKLMTE